MIGVCVVGTALVPGTPDETGTESGFIRNESETTSATKVPVLVLLESLIQ